MIIRRLYPSQSNDASPETDFDPADGAPPLAVATLPNSASAPSPDAAASAAAPVTKTYTATISNYTTEFTQFFAVGPTDYPEPWQVTVSGLQISISDPGGVNDAGSWNCTLTLLTGTPEGTPPPPPTDPNYVAFTASGSQVNISSVGFGAVGNVFTDGAMLTNDGGGVSFTGDLSSDQTQIVGTVSIGDPHIFPIDVPVTLILGGSPPPSGLFTTGNDTVDFAGTLSGVLGLIPVQVQAINAGAQLYNALGGTDTVTLPSSLDGTTYPLVAQSGAPPGIAWDPSQTFVVGSAADGPSNIDTIYAGTAGNPTLGSYKIRINGQATASITLYDNSNAINNTITLGTGNDTVTVDGNGNSTVTAGSGVDTLNISGGAYLTVSSGFVGSATIGANSTLEIQGSPIAIAALSGSANTGANSTPEIQGAAAGAGSGSGYTVAFAGSDGTLKIDAGATLPTLITGMMPGDTITLSGLPAGDAIAATVLKDNNMLAVYTTDAAHTEYDLNLDPTQKLSGAFGITGNNILLVSNSGPPPLAPATGYNKNIFPYNLICYIQVPNPTGGFSNGTGFIIGPNTILTAAHVVAGVPTDGVLKLPSTTLFVASPSNPFISGPYHISSQILSGTGASRAQNDFAIITVKDPLVLPQYFSLPPSTSAFPSSGKIVNVTGYPFAAGALLGTGAQFNGFGKATPDPQVNAVLDWNSTDPTSLVDLPGESGGPLWTMSGSTAIAWGIVANGNSDYTAGWNVQLTPPNVQTIEGWRAGANIDLGIFTANDFTGSGTSDALFYNNLTGDTWFEAMSNGAFAGWNQIGASNTYYSVAGVGDFYGSGTDDILFRNNSTGDTWFEAMSNGAFAGWNQIGGSDTHYAVVGVGDFLGNGTNDILFRNNSTGDTWVETISNGAFASWNQIGGSNTNYAAVGIGDFFGSGIDDILFRNNSTGDTWFEAISNGASAGWNQIGGSNTSYSVVGVADFYGSGTDDILFRNNLNGDTWIEAISNGAFVGWQQIGGSNTKYSVVGVGDYFGNGTSDILFLNNSTGDTWFEAISNGGSASWNQIGGSNTSYSVPIVA